MSAVLSEIVKNFSAEADKRGSWFELERAKRKLADLGKHVETIRNLIEKPDHYSTKQWEKVRTDVEWMARRLALVIERMDELRPLTVIDDVARPTTIETESVGE